MFAFDITRVCIFYIFKQKGVADIFPVFKTMCVDCHNLQMLCSHTILKQVGSSEF